MIFTLDFCGNNAIDIGNAKPKEIVHASVFKGILRRGKRRSKFLWLKSNFWHFTVVDRLTFRIVT